MLRNPVKKLVIDAQFRGEARRSKRKKLEREGFAEKEEEMASPELSNSELALAINQNSWEKLRLPDKFAELLEGREAREVKLREAGGGRRLWDVEVVFDGDGHMYLGRGWDQFAGAHHQALGNALIFSYDGGAVLTVNVFDDANAGSGSSSESGSNNSTDSASNNSRSAEMDIDDAQTSQFAVTLKKRHSGVRQQQYVNVPPVFQNAHGDEQRSKVVLRMPRKLWPVNLKHDILLVTIAVLICTMAAPTTAMHRTGGWEQISNVNTTEIQEIARWAVAEHARQANDGLQYKRVMSGMQQVVAGMNWILRIDAVNGDGQDCIYIAEVFDQSWTHTRTLDSFTPAQSTQGMCRLVAPPPNSMAPQPRPSFIDSVISSALFLCTAAVMTK